MDVEGDDDEDEALNEADVAQSKYAAQAEPALNPLFGNKVDWVRYVDELPSAGTDSQRSDGGSTAPLSAFWHVDVDKRTVYRLSDLSAKERQQVWDQIVGGGFPVEVTHKSFRIKIGEVLPTLEARLDEPIPAGKYRGCFLRHTHPKTEQRMAQPKSASPEAAMFLSEFAMALGPRDEVKPAEDLVWCNPGGKELSGGWNDIFGTLGQVTSIHLEKNIVYAKACHPDVEALRGVASCLRLGGSRFAIFEDGAGNCYLEMPGSPASHAA